MIHKRKTTELLAIALLLLIALPLLTMPRVTSVSLARPDAGVTPTVANSSEILIVAQGAQNKLQVYKLSPPALQDRDVSSQVTTIAELAVSASGCSPLEAQLTPDRTWLAVTFICSERLAQTQLVHLDTGTIQVIEGGSNYRVLKWFPDSKAILLRDIQRDLLTVAAPNVPAKFVDIPDQRYSTATAALEPDGLGVIYSTYDGLWHFDLGSAERMKLADSAPHGIPIIEMSPTGEWLAYVAMTENQGAGDLHLLKRPFDNPQQVEGRVLYRSACWSPKGRQLALVVSNSSSGDELGLVTPGSVDIHYLPGLPVGRITGLDWSPDGTWLVVAVIDQTSRGSIWLLDTVTNTPRLLLDGLPGKVVPVWPPECGQESKTDFLTHVPTRLTASNGITLQSAPQLWVPFDSGQTWTVTCGYGCSEWHQNADYYALDLARGCGDTCGQNVRATANGPYNGKAKVLIAQWDNTGYGNTIKLDHGDGYVSRYAHLQSMFVGQNQEVCRGQVIATVGNTGNVEGSCSTCPGGHLHYVVYHNGEAHRPEPLHGEEDYCNISNWDPLTSVTTEEFGGPTPTPTNTPVAPEPTSTPTPVCDPPSDEGATLCEHESFCGRCGTFTSDDGNLVEEYDDKATSIGIRGPFIATVFEHPNYGGFGEPFKHNDPDLHDNPIGNDTITSLRVYPAVALYEHTGFGGKCETFINDDPNLSGNYIGDNKVSSIKVPSGYVAILYEHPNYVEPSEDFTSDDSDLRDNHIGNDRVSSIRVMTITPTPTPTNTPTATPGATPTPTQTPTPTSTSVPSSGDGATICEYNDFRGTCGVFTSDTATLDPQYDDMATSLKIRGPFMATVYEHPNYGGIAETFDHEDSDLNNNPIDEDTISSLRVWPAAALYEHPSYEGRCQTFDGEEVDLFGTYIGGSSSSLKVPSGYSVTLCQQPSFGGTCQIFISDISDLRYTDVGDNAVSSICVLFADFNGNGQIDIGDIMHVASKWRCRREDGCYDERYDLDKDGIITIADIMVVAVHWGERCE